MSNEPPRKLPPFNLDQAAFRLIRRVLLMDWDAIGVLEYPTCDDEYDRYAPGFYDLLRGGATEEVLCDYLRGLEESAMRLNQKEPYLSRRAARRQETVRKIGARYAVLMRYAAETAAA